MHLDCLKLAMIIFMIWKSVNAINLGFCIFLLSEQVFNHLPAHTPDDGHSAGQEAGGSSGEKKGLRVGNRYELCVAGRYLAPLNSSFLICQMGILRWIQEDGYEK